jgi:NitT/TauT family transport system permease protein
MYAERVGNSFLMPNPGQVLKSLIVLLKDIDTYVIIATSLGRLAISIFASVVLGLILGLLSGIHYELEALLKPLVVTLRTLPVVSIIVVVLILYGNTFSLYLISFLLLFPIIYQVELDGIKNIDKTLLEVLKLDCDKCSFRSIRLVFFPLSMPFFRSGIIQSAGLGIKVLVVSEFIAQTKVSIGRELYYNKLNLEFSVVFAWTIILVFVVLLIEHLVNRYLKY